MVPFYILKQVGSQMKLTVSFRSLCCSGPGNLVPLLFCGCLGKRQYLAINETLGSEVKHIAGLNLMFPLGYQSVNSFTQGLFLPGLYFTH